MRSYTVNTEPVKVSINGIAFELIKSDGEAYAEIIQFLSETRAFDISSVADVKIVLRAGCDLIDSLLGDGACFKIFGAAPVSAGGLLSLLLHIGKDCVQAYHEYLAEEYLEG